jgi:hypothetical protein
MSSLLVFNIVNRREIILRGQSYISRLPKYWPPIPLSARRVCPPPATKAVGTHSPGGEGDGRSIFWKTREIGLPSYNDLSTEWTIAPLTFSLYGSPPSPCPKVDVQVQRREIITVRGQSHFSRLPKYWPPIPLSARRVCTPAFVAGGGQTRRAERGMGCQYFGRREK